MKIQVLGSAAYERIPSMFCNCAVCTKARKNKKKETRTQTQTLIDDKLLIDFGMDNYIHFANNDIDFSAIENLLVTHAHIDHFATPELVMRGGFGAHDLTYTDLKIYGTKEVGELYEKQPGYASQYIEIQPYKPFQAGKYTITAVPAIHGTPNPVCYIIDDGKKCLFYSLDTAVWDDEMYEKMKVIKKPFDMVLCDCTIGVWKGLKFGGHMSFDGNVYHREKLREIGLVTDKTVWMATHFSHNHIIDDKGNIFLTDELDALAKSYGMLSARDGITIEI